MIGHELLLCANDNESRILAIERDNDRYKIEFSSPFGFNPDDLIPIISENLEKTGITENYIVEVEACESKQIIYSYQIGGSNSFNIIPCKGREQPKACYTLFITLLTDQEQSGQANANISNENMTLNNGNSIGDKTSKDFYAISLFGIPVLLILGLFILYMRRNDKPNKDPNLIPIGNYFFDKNNMQLSLGKEVIELTSKEADLLFLLHMHTNNTIEREQILKSVWGDEGDYIGRTLDVFISKLRKKLESDENLKIVNIRGVGYKLVQN